MKRNFAICILIFSLSFSAFAKRDIHCLNSIFGLFNFTIMPKIERMDVQNRLGTYHLGLVKKDTTVNLSNLDLIDDELDELAEIISKSVSTLEMQYNHKISQKKLKKFLLKYAEQLKGINLNSMDLNADMDEFLVANFPKLTKIAIPNTNVPLLRWWLTPPITQKENLRILDLRSAHNLGHWRIRKILKNAPMSLTKVIVSDKRISGKQLANLEIIADEVYEARKKMLTEKYKKYKKGEYTEEELESYLSRNLKKLDVEARYNLEGVEIKNWDDGDSGKRAYIDGTRAGIADKIGVRIHGYNAAETDHQAVNEAERKVGIANKHYLQYLIKYGTHHGWDSEGEKDVYGRWIGPLYIEGQNYGDAMVHLGYGHRLFNEKASRDHFDWEEVVKNNPEWVEKWYENKITTWEKINSALRKFFFFKVF